MDTLRDIGRLFFERDQNITSLVIESFRVRIVANVFDRAANDLEYFKMLNFITFLSDKKNRLKM